MTAELPSTTGADVDSLSKLVSLSRPPLTVRWRKSLLSEPGLGPTDWKLTAVIELTAGDADALAASLKPLPGARPALSAAEEAWLTAPVRIALDSATVYDAAPLGKSPLKMGSIARLKGSNVFVLVMITS